MNSIGLLGDGSLWRYKREFLNKHIKPIFLFIQYCGTYRALSIICGVKLRIKRRIVKYVFLLFFGCKNDNILLPILSARCANNAISGFGNIKISNGLIDKCPYVLFLHPKPSLLIHMNFWMAVRKEIGKCQKGINTLTVVQSTFDNK
eukprot:333603_1